MFQLTAAHQRIAHTLEANGQTHHFIRSNVMSTLRSIQDDFKTLLVVIYPSCCIGSMLLQVYAMHRECVFVFIFILDATFCGFQFSNLLLRLFLYKQFKLTLMHPHICAACPLTNYLEAFKKSLSKQFCQFLKSYAHTATDMDFIFYFFE